MFEDDLDDFSDVCLITAMLIGTSKEGKMEHATRIQKMAFLVDKIMGQHELDEEFDFGPDKFGPMSETVENSVKLLANERYVTLSKGQSNGATLTEEGSELVKAAAHKYPGVFELCKRLNEDLSDLTTIEIVKIVYRLYPSDAVNSLIRYEMPVTQKVDSISVNPDVDGFQMAETENGIKVSIKVKNGIITIGW